MDPKLRHVKPASVQAMLSDKFGANFCKFLLFSETISKFVVDHFLSMSIVNIHYLGVVVHNFAKFVTK
jgi:hypothetical protein